MKMTRKRSLILMEERNVLKPVDVVVNLRGEVREGMDGKVDEDRASYHVRYHGHKDR